MKRPQRTIKNETEVAGTGLYSGVRTRVRLKPALVDAGLTFIRQDLPGSPVIPAKVDSLLEQPHRTALGKGNATVEMVEHLLAALSGLQVDNLTVVLEGPDIPNVDGSATCFVEALSKAGFVEQEHPRQALSLSEPVGVSQANAALVAMPTSEGLTISYTLDYNNNAIPRQSYSLTVTPKRFTREVAPARTFVPEFQVPEFQRLGLGKGATYKNTLVVGENGVIDNELRFPDEFARHKILDLLGDLYLLNVDLRAHLVGIRSGHALNARLLKKLARERDKKLGRSLTLEVEKILNILPHRYPMLLVDRVIELEAGRRAVGIKNVTFNEEFFQGHFPGKPVMPGVLQLEAMAQLAGVLLMSNRDQTDKLPMLMSIDNAKLRRPVLPGDQLVLEVTVLTVTSRTGHVLARARVEDKLVAQAEMKFKLMHDKEESS